MKKRAKFGLCFIFIYLKLCNQLKSAIIKKNFLIQIKTVNPEMSSKIEADWTSLVQSLTSTLDEANLLDLMSEFKEWGCDLNNNNIGFEPELCFGEGARLGNLCERSDSTTSSDSGCCLSDELIVKKRDRRVLGGVSGRSKFTDLKDNREMNAAWKDAEDDGDKMRLSKFNFGDDVGFLCRRKMMSDDLFGPRLLDKVYFGIADGVSANRARGYDARLFPNALLASVAKSIASSQIISSTNFGKSGQDYLNYS